MLSSFFLIFVACCAPRIHRHVRHASIGHMIKAIHRAAKSNVSIPTIGAAHRNVRCSEAGMFGRLAPSQMTKTAQKV
jgi:hypothetical protein